MDCLLLRLFLVGHGVLAGKHRMRVWFVDVPVSGTTDVSDWVVGVTNAQLACWSKKKGAHGLVLVV